jgi:hypothetical protein
MEAGFGRDRPLLSWDLSLRTSRICSSVQIFLLFRELIRGSEGQEPEPSQ